MLESIYQTDPQPYERTELDKWLVERYCLYMNNDDKLYRYDIHHPEWEIKRVQLKHLKLQYKVGELTLTEQPPDLTHFSPGVKVLAWPRQLVAQ